MLAYFYFYAMLCDITGTPLSESYYDFWRAGRGHQTCIDEGAVKVTVYMAVYASILVVCLFGFTFMLGGCTARKQSLSWILVFLWGGLSVLDYWSLCELIAFFDGLEGKEVVSYARNESGFKLCAVWLAETYIYLTTAWESFDNKKEKTKVTKLENGYESIPEKIEEI